ncbi:NAD(P)H-binding protein [Lacticaseibacillus nasuensis]|uniref:NAD(P)H-binding protein n=1 Tax=Lacticaseibacillus nasuensis TaxID=944671 RepID=UPI002245D28E|nr:NAD(P)H-binding protein [Lacticaseibacillus nasuensis]MCX2455696.1 NAD(P)H-binding protein [Lacticaseibacillus nasuensis]
MKIFVIGAHGQVGQLLVATLSENDFQVIGGYRDPANQAPQATTEFTPVAFDLNAPIATLAAKMQGADGVIFAAGSQGKALLAVDLDGAVKAMMAAEAAGIKRFIQLSAFHADDRAHWPDSLHDYYIAKYYADEWLRHRTQLDYVIIAPITLTNGEATGALTTEPTATSTITRQDVASVLARAVTSDLHRETLNIANGAVPIAQCL